MWFRRLSRDSVKFYRLNRCLVLAWSHLFSISRGILHSGVLPRIKLLLLFVVIRPRYVRYCCRGRITTKSRSSFIRSNSSALRPILLSWISAILIFPSGFTTKVPRYAIPSSSIITPKARLNTPVGSASIG